MILSHYLLVAASAVDDEPAAREALERDLHAALDRHGANVGATVDHDVVRFSLQREDDEALAIRQAVYDAECAERGEEPHELARLAWLWAEASVSGPSNGPPPA